MKIAVLIPCHNEASDHRSRGARFQGRVAGRGDLSSTTTTRTTAPSRRPRAAGAIVRAEPLQGKGNVVRRMFADIEADVYVLVDGDGTYDAPCAPDDGAAHCRRRPRHGQCGARRRGAAGAYRAGHRFGNALLTGIVAWIFGDRFDRHAVGLSRASRRFVKSFPALADRLRDRDRTDGPCAVAETAGRRGGDPLFRAPRSAPASKLQTYRDGARILATIVKLLKEERPSPSSRRSRRSRRRSRLSARGADFRHLCEDRPGAALSHRNRGDRNHDPRLPLLVSAFILDSVRHGRLETRRLFYFRLPAAAQRAFAQDLSPRSGKGRSRGLRPQAQILGESFDQGFAPKPSGQVSPLKCRFTTLKPVRRPSLCFRFSCIAPHESGSAGVACTRFVVLSSCLVLMGMPAVGRLSNCAAPKLDFHRT